MSSTEEKNAEVVRSLNELLTRAYDAEKGYEEAAEKVSDDLLKKIFLDTAKQRYDFGHELKDEIRRLGGTPDKGSSLAGDAHRLWMSVRTALSGKDEKAVLDEVLRGEKEALRFYEKTLENVELQNHTRLLLKKQYDRIELTEERMEEWDEMYAAS